jgi:hypothetical protein
MTPAANRASVGPSVQPVELLLKGVRTRELGLVQATVTRGATLAEILSTLTLAFHNGHLEIVEYLVKASCSRHDDNERGFGLPAVLANASLIQAVFDQKLEDVRKALEQGPTNQHKVFCVALYLGNEDIVKCFRVEGGVDNSSEWCGESPDGWRKRGIAANHDINKLWTQRILRTGCV